MYTADIVSIVERRVCRRRISTLAAYEYAAAVVRRFNAVLQPPRSRPQTPCFHKEITGLNAHSRQSLRFRFG